MRFTYRWLGTTLLGSMAVLGCSQTQRQPSAMVRPVTPGVVYQTYPSGGTPVVTKLPDAQVVVETPPPVPAQAAVKPEVEAQPASFTTSSAKSDAVPRRDYGDVTARPGFAHDPNYSWLQGELRYLHSRNSWHLCYASADDTDRYGGHVILVEGGRMMNDVKDGQMVRVQGEIMEPDSTEVGSSSYRFRVRSIEPMSNP